MESTSHKFYSCLYMKIENYLKNTPENIRHYNENFSYHGNQGGIFNKAVALSENCVIFNE